MCNLHAIVVKIEFVCSARICLLSPRSSCIPYFIVSSHKIKCAWLVESWTECMMMQEQQQAWAGRGDTHKQKLCQPKCQPACRLSFLKTQTRQEVLSFIHYPVCIEARRIQTGQCAYLYKLLKEWSLSESAHKVQQRHWLLLWKPLRQENPHGGYANTCCHQENPRMRSGGCQA